MKNNISNHFLTLLIFSFAVILMSACGEDEPQVELFEKPVFGGFSTNTDILSGETITFTDTSTKVVSRQWSLPGGSPASSSDSVVIVEYRSGGSFEASLTVQHIDNQIKSQLFAIEVEGPVLETYGLFSEASFVTFGHQLALEGNNGFDIATTTETAFDGEKSILFKSTVGDFPGDSTWGVQGSLRPFNVANVDISGYATGTFKVAIKTNCQGVMWMRMHSLNSGGEQRAILTLDPVAETYGLKRDGQWHELSIPMQDFLDANPNLDFTKITHLLVLRSHESIESPVRASDDWDWYVDSFYLEKESE